MRHLVHFALIAAMLISAQAWLPAEDEDQVIVVVRKESAEAKEQKGLGPARQPTIEEIYDRYTNFPGQIWLDSPSGRKPLFGMDVVYDQNGYPVPRLPDPYTYAVLKNPQDPECLRQYLDWRRAAIRRINSAANSVPDYGFTSGAVPTSVFSMGQKIPYDNKATGDYSKLTKESLGTPMVSDAKARELGLKPSEIPSLPGKPSESGIEVYWFWHHKCPICLQMARDWFAFQHEVNTAGYKAVSINCAPLRSSAEIEAASLDVSSTIEVWTVLWGTDVEQSRNWLDWTDAAKGFGITGTPTTVFLNRKTLAIERLVGSEDPASLRATLAKVGGWDPNVWPPPKVAQAEVQDRAQPVAPASAAVTPVRDLNR